jgi:hypothetical protein
MGIVSYFLSPSNFLPPSPPDLLPPQPFHKSLELPLFKRIWSPAALQDMSILTWSYRITFSAMSFMLIAFLVDAVVGNLYRFTFGNVGIYIHNERFAEKQSIYLKERNRVLKNRAIAAAAFVGTVAAIYFLKRSFFPSIPSNPSKTLSPPNPDSLPKLLEITEPKAPIEIASSALPIIDQSISPVSRPAFFPVPRIRTIVGFCGFFAFTYLCAYLYQRSNRTYFDLGTVVQGTNTQFDINAGHACTFISKHAVASLMNGSLNLPIDVDQIVQRGALDYGDFYAQNKAQMDLANEFEPPWYQVASHTSIAQAPVIQSFDKDNQPIPRNNTYKDSYHPSAETSHQAYYKAMLDRLREAYLNGKAEGTKVGAILIAGRYTVSFTITKKKEGETYQLFDSHGAKVIYANGYKTKDFKAYKITFSAPHSYEKFLAFLNNRFPVSERATPADYGLFPVLLP